MPGLVPGIHVLSLPWPEKTWMAGHRRAEETPAVGRLSPAMTETHRGRGSAEARFPSPSAACIIRKTASHRISTMSLQAYLAFVAACFALALIPGPVVTVVVAKGLRHGTRAALTNIAGVQAGLTIVIGIVTIGLTSLMATMVYWFDWVRFAVAAYLVWLGVKLIRAPVTGVDADAPPPPPRGGFFLQGFVGLVLN